VVRFAFDHDKADSAQYATAVQNVVAQRRGSQMTAAQAREIAARHVDLIDEEVQGASGLVRNS
jgi:hypothetical protein